MDQRAGVWPVEEGGSSSSSGPAVPEDVEESEPVKKLVVPTAPTATYREENTASGHAVFRTWCRECCIGRGRIQLKTHFLMRVDNLKKWTDFRDEVVANAAGMFKVRKHGSQASKLSSL